MPLVSQIKMLLTQFEKGAKARGKPTSLFLDPGKIENPFEDKELLSALEQKLKADPKKFKLPEGFKKKVEKAPVYEYKVPEFLRSN